MKALRKLLIILLLFYFINGQKGYSIDEFIFYLQEKEYYDIIQIVKYYFGDDVAIDFCKQLTNSSKCEDVVRYYMTTGSRPITPKISFEDLLKEKKVSEYFIKEIYNLYKGVDKEDKFLIYIIVNSYDILIQKMEETQILTLIKKMILKKKITTATQKIVY